MLSEHVILHCEKKALLDTTCESQRCHVERKKPDTRIHVNEVQGKANPISDDRSQNGRGGCLFRTGDNHGGNFWAGGSLKMFCADLAGGSMNV